MVIIGYIQYFLPYSINIKNNVGIDSKAIMLCKISKYFKFL